MQTGKRKVPHTYKELIRRITTFKYKKLLQSLNRKQTKNKASISYMPGALWDKFLDFTDKPLVQCDVLAVKHISLDDCNNDNCKYVLLGILKVLFLELILFIVLVS